MIFDINPQYCIAVTNADQVSPRYWQAKACIHRRDTQQAVGQEFTGEGISQCAANNAAFHAAKKHLETLGFPEAEQPAG